MRRPCRRVDVTKDVDGDVNDARVGHAYSNSVGSHGSRPFTRWGSYGTAAEFASDWLFSWTRYAQTTGLNFNEKRAAWQHFRKTGQYEDVSTSPFLAVPYIRQALGVSRKTDIFAAWTEASPSFSPTPFFDARHYMITHRDVRLSGMDAFPHWLMFGLFEGRSPSASVELQPIELSGDTARHKFVQSLASLDDLMEGHAGRAAINVRGLRSAYPDCPDVTAAVLAGEIPFCTDPQILFGDVGAILADDSAILGRLAPA